MWKNHGNKEIFFSDPYIGRQLFLVILFIIIECTPMFAQTDTLVNLDANNTKVSALLNRLRHEYKLNLSYNASDSAFNKEVSVKASNQPIREVLADLLRLSGHQYKIIDNQFVIFPLKEIPFPKTTLHPTLNKDIPIEVKRTDTVYLDRIIHKTDTLVRVDTIIQRDTVIKLDTITVFREPTPEKLKSKIRNIRADVFNNDARRNEGWAVGFSYGKLLTDFKIKAIDKDSDELAEMIDESEHLSFRSDLFSMNAVYNYYKFKAGITIDYSSITSKFNFNKVISTGGLYDVDTLDTYYTLIGVDTNWVYITDSAWIPLNKTAYYYHQLNNLSYLNFLVNAAYAVIHNRNLELSLQTGIGLNYLLSTGGSTITKTTDYAVIDYKEMEFNKLNYSFMVGMGGRYKLNDAFDFTSEIYYLFQLKDIYQSNRVSSKLNGVGIKLGILYYL
jgi:hypothetical protein